MFATAHPLLLRTFHIIDLITTFLLYPTPLFFHAPFQIRHEEGVY